MLLLQTILLAFLIKDQLYIKYRKEKHSYGKLQMKNQNICDFLSSTCWDKELLSGNIRILLTVLSLTKA